MNILYLCYREQAKIVGGTGEVFSYLTSLMPSFGAKVYICTPSREENLIPQDDLLNGTPCYFTQRFKPNKFLFLQRKAVNQLANLARDLKIDIVHAKGLYHPGFAAYALKKALKLPYVITSHGDMIPQSSPRMLKPEVRKVCRKILHHADALTHLNGYMADISHEIADTRQKSVIIPNGIESALWTKHHQKNAGHYLLGMGRLIPEKGFHVVIDAYAQLVKQGVTLPLVIAGKGEQLADLINQAIRHGLPVTTSAHDLTKLPPASVCFPGFMFGEEKIRTYANAKLVLFPTQPDIFEEAFAMVIMESMAAAKPLLMSQLAVTPYFQELGVKFEVVKQPANATEWAEKTLFLLNKKNLEDDYGTPNFPIASSFEWQQIASQYHNVYKNVLSR